MNKTATVKQAIKDLISGVETRCYLHGKTTWPPRPELKQAIEENESKIAEAVDILTGIVEED